MDTSWDDIRLFLAVAEADSISAAARVLDIGQATASRRIARLEDALGYPLFARSVEGAELTASGTAMLAAARTMQDGALAFQAAAKGTADALFGRVRVTAAPGVAVDLLAPFGLALYAVHPGIRLEILSSVGHLDPARGEADIALRTREPRDPELAEVASGSARLGVYVAASYHAELPRPCSLRDLKWVGWAPPHEGLAPEDWVRENVEDYAPVFVADSFVVQEQAVARGLGAMLLPDVQAALVPNLKRVTLTPKLEKRLPRLHIFLVVAKSAWRSPRVRAVANCFVDWLNEQSDGSLERTLD